MRERLLQQLRQRPFQPFRLHVTNGAVHLIRHPDQMLVSPSYVIIGVPLHEDSGQEISEAVTVALIHIVSIEPFTPATVSGTN